MQDSAGIYLRISDDREGRALGVTRQDEDCTSLAARLNVKVHRVYKDNDISASTRSTKPRPDYKQLVADAKAGLINVIIAYTSGRLTRRPREHEDLIELAEQYGVRFHYVASPSFDLNTSAGRRVARILAANDAGEAEDIAERVTRAKKERAESGQYLGGYRAYGYEGPSYNEQGELTNRGRINTVPIPHETEVIRSSVRRIGLGETAYVVMKDLNQHGIPSPGGKQWTVGNFKRTITKKRYVIFDDNDPEQRGTLEHQGQEYRAVWPGIVTRTEYELMMAQLNKINQQWNHGLVKGRTYLLTGFIYCGACGGIAYGNARKVGDHYQRRYRCKAHDNHGNRIGCGKVFRVAEPLEQYVMQCVLVRFDTPEVVKALASNQTSDEMSVLVTKLTQLRKRRTDLVSEYGRGEHTKDEYKLMLSANDTAIAELEAELVKVQNQYTASQLPAISMLRETIGSTTIEQRRTIARLVVDRVEILPHGHTGSRTWNGYRFNPESVRIVWRDVAMNQVIASLWLLMNLRRSGLALAA